MSLPDPVALRDYKRKWAKSRSDRFMAMGLNWRGKPYKNRKHPELAGLDKKTWRKFYMRNYRMGFKQNMLTPDAGLSESASAESVRSVQI